MECSLCEYYYHKNGPKGRKCGYCGSTDGKVSNGMWAHYLTCEDYQDLIDRGWRRSGKYCYKPIMDRTCSPQYTIRCEATKFRLSKSQKKVLKTMSDYLVKGETRKLVQSGAGSTSNSRPSSSANKDASADSESNGAEKKAKSVRPGIGADPSKPPCRKAKEIRREQKILRNETAKSDCSAMCYALANDQIQNGMCKPQATSVGASLTGTHVHMPSSAKSDNYSDIPDFLKVGPDGKKPLEAFLSLPTDAKLAHKLELKLVRSHPPSPEFNSTFKESYELYKKYQMIVHKDTEEKCTEKQYRRFLCDSPLIPKEGAASWPCGYGSYHHHYRIDGRLVAVGVIDILPVCLSSVYTYYDPDFNFLSLGVYTALRELEMTRKMYLGDPEHFLYYCMGYYVHECQKMRYKGQYYPSYLLCPESYQFIPIETCRPKLDASRYAHLNDEASPPEDVSTWLDKSLVLFQRTLMPYGVYKMLAGTKEDAKVTEYARFVGPSVAPRMALVLGVLINHMMKTYTVYCLCFKLVARMIVCLQAYTLYTNPELILAMYSNVCTHAHTTHTLTVDLIINLMIQLKDSRTYSQLSL